MGGCWWKWLVQGTVGGGNRGQGGPLTSAQMEVEASAMGTEECAAEGMELVQRACVVPMGGAMGGVEGSRRGVELHDGPGRLRENGDPRGHRDTWLG